MAKKRNCRRTPEEVSIHEEAVKLRKMTDAQLVEKIRSASAAASKLSTAFRQQSSSAKSAAEFLEAFANANIPGVGKITLKKMNTFAKDNGYL
jgi:hypothetical protein